MNRFNAFQVPKSVGSSNSSHVLGESTRRANLSEGDGTGGSSFEGSNSKLKDKRFSGANAPGKQMFSGTISFGDTGTTGRS